MIVPYIRLINEMSFFGVHSDKICVVKWSTYPTCINIHTQAHHPFVVVGMHQTYMVHVCTFRQPVQGDSAQKLPKTSSLPFPNLTQSLTPSPSHHQILHPTQNPLSYDPSHPKQNLTPSPKSICYLYIIISQSLT